MIDINKEAQEFLNNKWVKGSYNGKLFIAGHNSKATQAKVLQAQIDILTECGYDYRDAIIKKLQQQLKELKDE
jgi:hypothetical protein